MDFFKIIIKRDVKFDEGLLDFMTNSTFIPFSDYKPSSVHAPSSSIPNPFAITPIPVSSTNNDSENEKQASLANSPRVDSIELELALAPQLPG